MRLSCPFELLLQKGVLLHGALDTSLLMPMVVFYNANTST